MPQTTPLPPRWRLPVRHTNIHRVEADAVRSNVRPVGSRDLLWSRIGRRVAKVAAPQRVEPGSAGNRTRPKRHIRTSVRAGTTELPTEKGRRYVERDRRGGPNRVTTKIGRIRDANFRRVSKRFLNDSDEELAQFALSGEVFKGTRYEHHTQGTIESLPGLTIDDVKDFYRDHYTRDNVVFALSGSYPETLIERLRADLSRLGRGGARELVALELAPIEGRRVVLMSKPGAPTSISFGVPIEVRRGSREFYALTIANAWLGQHRKGFGRLFDIIRRKRGLNYGNYSYIEAFKWRGSRMLPHSGLGRRQQMFEVWLRSLPREHAVFALRAALREIEKLAADGLTQGQFDMARKYVRRYSRFFAKSDGERLGYALDDVYYDITPGHLTRLRQMTDELTLDEVNAAVKKHFRIENLVIAIVTDDASGLKTALVSEMPSPVSYPQPASAKIVEEDKEIARHPLNISEENVKVISPEQVFMRRD